jgi:hypothetical protein
VNTPTESGYAALRRLARALETHLVVGFADEIADLGDTPGIDAREADLIAVG